MGILPAFVLKTLCAYITCFPRAGDWWLRFPAPASMCCGAELLVVGLRAAGRSLIRAFVFTVAGGSLRSMLSEFGPLEEAVIALYTRQILLGLRYLHSQACLCFAVGCL